MAWGSIEVEPEVEGWLLGLSDEDFGILLTVFHKTRQRDRAEIDRAERAMKRCIEEGHTAEEET